MLKSKYKLIFRITIVVLFIILFLTGARIISFEKYIDNILLMFLILVVMFFVVYKYRLPISINSEENKAKEEEIEERGYTKEGAIGIVGFFIFWADIFFEEKLILMFSINILGLIIMGFAVFLQYKKPRGNKYVLRNAKIYLFAWIATIILFIVLMIILYFKFADIN